MSNQPPVAEASTSACASIAGGQAQLDLTGHVLLALRFAADKHRNQRRKDAEGTPYINHPIAVAALLAVEAGIHDADTLVAACLHDTVEDTQTTFDEIQRHFGSAVAELARELTDDKSLPKAVRKQLQIEHAAQASPRAKLIKIADKICNLRDITASPPKGWPLERRREYVEWAQRVVVGCRGVSEKLEHLFDAAATAALAALAALA